MHYCGSALGGTQCNQSDWYLSSQTPVPLVVPITSRDQLRTVINSSWQPGFLSQCLLIPQCLLSCKSISTLMQQYTLRHSYSADHPISTALKFKSASRTLVYFITPTDLPIASCSALSRTDDRRSDVKMIFTGYCQHTPIRTLFDSGADLTFISSSLCKLLELPISIPTHKAVATATGQCTPILGRVTFSDVPHCVGGTRMTYAYVIAVHTFAPAGREILGFWCQFGGLALNFER